MLSRQMTLVMVVIAGGGLSLMAGVKKGIGGVAVTMTPLTAGTMAGGERVGVAGGDVHVFIPQI